MRIILLIVFLAIIHPLKAGDADKGFRFNRPRNNVSIPIEVRNNLAVMPVYINDRGPFYFILDTGVKTTILIEPMIAHLLDLNITETIVIYGLGGEGIVNAALATNVTISMPGITGKNKNLIVIPEDILNFSEVFGFPVYGIIGYDFFKHFPVEINYPRQIMTVYQSPEMYRIRRRSTVVPFRLVDGKPYVETTIHGQNGSNLTTYLLFDLGASHPIYLNREYITLSDQTIRGFLGKGISGNLMGQMGRIDSISMGGLSVDGPVVAYPDDRFLTFYGHMINWEGIIGGGIIKRFNVIIDYASQQLVMSRSHFHSEPFSTSLSGIEVIASGPNLRNFKIHYVRPGSAGYEAGVIPGDRIIELNSKTHQDLSLDDILDELSGKEGDYIFLTVLRGNDLIKTRFRLREDLWL